MSSETTSESLFGEDEQSQNWVTAIHLMSVTQAGLLKFVSYVAKLLQCNAMDEIAEGHHIGLDGKCNQCKNHRDDCAKRVFKDVIGNAWNKNVIDENNINVYQWCENAWTIAKAFMHVSHNTKSPEEMDLDGFLNFMIKCKLFNNFLEQPKICSDVSVLPTLFVQFFKNCDFMSFVRYFAKNQT